MEHQWHYKDEKNGTRLGPVGTAEIERLIATDHIERATLVWNPAMPEWARASSTELVQLFGDQPPPMPAHEVNRTAIYLVALLPIWGTVVEALASYALSDRIGMTPVQMMEQRGWMLFFIVANGLFGTLDGRSLRKAGLKLKGATIMAALLIPVYIFASCRTVARYAGERRWLAYAPFVLWILATVGGVYLTGVIEDQLL